MTVFLENCRTSVIRIVVPIITLMGMIIITNGGWRVQAQVSEGGIPESFQRDVPDVTPHELDVLIVDDGNERGGRFHDESATGVPFEFGKDRDVQLSLADGTWTVLPNGDRIWRLRLRSPGAFSLNLQFGQFILPEGGKLFIYNEERSQRQGAFTHKNNKGHNRLATAPIAGDDITIEYFEPREKRGEAKLRLTKVVHGYKNIFGKRDKTGYGDSGSCNVNVHCSEGAPYSMEKNAIVMILLSNGTRICSGSLMNNTSEDETPYILTAFHCADDSPQDGFLASGEISELEDWVVVFNYQSSGCTDSDGSTSQSVSGSTLKAAYAGSDMLLIERDAAVPVQYNPYYAGWDKGNTAPSSAATIHHPSGDIKKLSIEEDPLTSTQYGGTTTNSSYSYWRIADWDLGTTEPGSSGSGLFDDNNRVIGQLRGGYAACGNSLSDWFGKLSKSWTGGGTSSTRLSDWLDPTSSGTSTLDGKPAELYVNADGPTCLEEGNDGLFWADAYGGIPPRSIAWEFKPICLSAMATQFGPSCTSWNSAGSGQNLYFGENRTEDFRMRAVVTDDVSDTEVSNEIYVTVQSSSCGGMRIANGSARPPRLAPESGESEMLGEQIITGSTARPNPFNPITTLTFILSERTEVLLELYDATGRRIETLANSVMDSGTHMVEWNADDQASGMYFYVIRAGTEVHARSVIVLK